MLSQGFSKQLRLLNASEYQVVFDNAPLRVSDKHLLLLARPNQKTCPRMGLVVAKKNLRHAVSRNRFKRIARESFRLQQQELAGIDVIVLARREANEVSQADLRKIFDRQWSRLKKKFRDSQREVAGA